jgi:hypothetical protein
MITIGAKVDFGDPSDVPNTMTDLTSERLWKRNEPIVQVHIKNTKCSCRYIISWDDF